MNFFKQVIFPPSPKKEEVPLDEELYYYMEYHDTEIWFMVECPLCKRRYKYSVIASSSAYNLMQGIEDNETFFRKEWIDNCPHAEKHNAIKANNILDAMLSEWL